MESYDILVIILSVTLAILLVMGIVLMYFLIKFARSINEITEKAQDVVDNVESASRIFQKSAAPVAFTRVVSNVVDIFKDEQKKSKKRK